MHERPHPKKGQSAEWALHIQFPWRIVHASRILVSWGDFYVLPDGDEPYDWDAGGDSLFDVLAE
jgi:hypothetical protein